MSDVIGSIKGKMVSIAVSIVLISGLMPASAFAEEGDDAVLPLESTQEQESDDLSQSENTNEFVGGSFEDTETEVDLKDELAFENDSVLDRLSSSPESSLSTAGLLSYQTHVQNVGWQTAVGEGETSGTSGRALRLEGIRISLTDETKKLGGSVRYRTHVQNIGWQGFVSDGEMSGTSARSLRLEAIQIELLGNIATYYDVYYRVHAQNVGWMGWAKNGASSGTAGYSYRLEAIQIVLVAKGEAAPSGAGSVSTTCFVDAGAIKGNMTYNSFLHIQNIGDTSYNGIDGGTLMGTSGRGLRLEAFSIELNNDSEISGGITYRTHVQNIGWQGWMSDGERAGTSGKAYRLEALQIKLTGELAHYYDVYYQVHVQNIGWQGWVANGSVAGTSGLSYRLESMRIAIVQKGETPPVAITNPPSPSPGGPDQDQYNSATVYFTDTGIKYHRDGCRHLAHSKYAISRGDALSRGYSPCGTCKPG